MMLTRDAILGADDLPMEKVSVPEWGGDVMVRTMTGADRDLFEDMMYGETRDKNKDKVRATVVSLAACDKDGNLLFTLKDIDALKAKSAKALQRVFNVATRLNGISDKDVDQMAKNSEADPTEGSTSD